ncbi:MAG: hypothetical protein IBJ11_02725 [Phycisphaerales bacterium]|nr:hypothetical protein [Phycisphaerales bacterium]
MKPAPPSTPAAPQPAGRGMLAHGLIAVAVCAGAYMVFVDPASRQLAEARARTQAALADERRAEQVRAQLPRVIALAEHTKRQREWISTQSAPASDAGRLYDSVVSLAAEAGVRVDHLTPRDGPRTGSGQRPSGPNPPKDTALQFGMSVTGSYTGVTRFVGALQDRIGFTRILNVRIAPAAEKDEGKILAVIETEHHSFDTTPPPSAPAAAAPQPQRAHP